MPELGAPARIPLSEPTIGALEARYVRECMDENWIAANGRFVRELEALFAEIHGQPTAVSTVSGTAALHLGMVELGVGPGDEVIVPALTFVATANAVRYTGAMPVFVDVDPVTYTIDPAAVAAAITPRTRALVAVHLYGHPADMDSLGEIARQHRLAIVEDAAEALGSIHRGRRCGTIGDIGCFSFNGNKAITAGGGGMVIASDPARLEHIRHLSRQGRQPDTREYLHDEIAFNYTLSNLHAAIGLAQLERLDELVDRRRAIAARYASAIAEVPGLTFCEQAPWARSNFWLMSVLVDERAYGRSRRQLMGELDRAGIDSRPLFTPLPDIGAYRDTAAVDIPVSRRLHDRGLSLPSSASLAEADQERVIAELLTR
jgi:perosamine synthetase